MVQSTGEIEYTDCISTEVLDTPQKSVLDITQII